MRYFLFNVRSQLFSIVAPVNSQTISASEKALLLASLKNNRLAFSINKVVLSSGSIGGRLRKAEGIPSAEG